MFSGFRARAPFVVGLVTVSAFLFAGCGDDPTKANELEVEPGLTLEQVAVTGERLGDDRTGPAPLEVDFTIQVATADPRANVEIYIDFGDGDDESEVTLTSLPAELNPDDPAELEPETRTAAFTHLFEEPGEYTVTVWAKDLTNSTPDTETEVGLDIITQVQTIDVTALKLPDLIAVSLTTGDLDGDGEPDQGPIEIDDPFEIVYQVLNDGSDIERAFFVDVYLVALPDTKITELADTATAVKLTRQPSPGTGLLSGDSLNETLSLQICDARANPTECDERRVTMAGKTWYPAIFVDPPNADRPELNIDENDEANNFRVSAVGIEIEPERDLPDLSALNIVANPATTDILRDVSVSFDIRNLSETAAPPSTYRIFLSTDQTLDPLDEELGSGQAAPIMPETTQVISNLSFPLREEITDAQDLWVIVKVDGNELIPEIDEANNFGVAERRIQITGAQQAEVDLSVENLNVTPPNTYLGGQLRVQFDVRNPEMDDPGSYQCGVFLSTDDMLDVASDSLMLIVAEDTLPGLQVENYDRTLFVPDFISTGNYWVFVYCDHLELLIETDESNNIASTTNPVAVGDSPDIDFYLQNLVVTPLSVNEQDWVTFSVDLCNAGTDFGGIVELGAYISGDGTIDPGDLLVTNEITFTPLAPGGCETIMMMGKVSCLPFIDTYTIGVYVDPSGSLIEADENNNAIADASTLFVQGGMGSFCQCIEDGSEGGGNNTQGTASPIMLTGTNPATANVADLSICDLTDFYSVSLNRGDSIDVTITFDNTIGDLDLLIHDANHMGAPLLSSTNTNVETVSHRVDATGPIYIEVFGNTNVDRNYFDLDITVVPSDPNPELYISEIDLVSTTNPSIILPFEFDVYVGNNGLTDGTSVEVAAYLSSDGVIDAGDILVGTMTTTAPSLGVSSPVRFVYNWPMGQQTETFKVIARVDPNDTVMELDETNNDLSSVDVDIDADCVPDAFEGMSGNNTAMAAFPVRPGAGFTEYPGLNVCSLGRDDYYLVCVPSDVDINWLGAGGIPAPSYSNEVEIEIFDRDLVSKNTDWSGADGVAGDWLAPNTCSSDANCPSAESCVNNRCEDASGEHCVYFKVNLETNAQVVSKDYTLVVDALPRSLAGEPTNDARSTAIDYSPGPHSISPTMLHTQPYDDHDWYVLNLDAGTQFDIDIRAASPYARVRVYEGSSTSSNYIYPYEPETITMSATGPIYFEVYMTTSSYDYDVGYILDLQGIQGLDLAPENVTGDLSNVPPGDPVIVTWDFKNRRLDAVPMPGTVEYRYLLSVDQVPDASDIVVQTKTGVAPLPFQTLQIQDKVYMTVPPMTFGDFYLIVETDPNDLLVEVNENNDSAWTQLTIQQDCMPDASEPNNSTGTATMLGSPVGMPLYYPNLTVCENDGDFFSASIPVGATWEVRIDGMVANSGDIDLFLLDSSGGVLDSSEGLSTTSETITYTNMTGSAQAVYIEVRQFRSFYTNVYDLTVTNL